MAGRKARARHIGVVANSGEIVAVAASRKDIDDAAMVDAPLDQIADPIASFTADGVYDQDQVSEAVAARHLDAAVIVPPRAGAVASASAETAPTQRDRHLRMIGERGRMVWQKASGLQSARQGRGVDRSIQTCDRRCPSIAHRADRGDRGCDRCRCPQPDAGVRTPEVCPYRLNNRSVGVLCPCLSVPRLHATQSAALKTAHHARPCRYLAGALLVAWALAVPALPSPPALILRPAAPPAVSACTRRTAATNAMERWDRAVPARLSRPVRYPPPRSHYPPRQT
jgi:hypothetical protein